MIKIQNISKHYGDFIALEDVNFNIEKNKINCLVGKNGAGKTTIIKILLNQLDKTTGEIIFKDKINLNEISYLAEERGLYIKNSVYENIEYFCNLAGTKNIKNRIDEILKEFEIEKYKNFKVSKLSKGNAQKVQLACIFAPNSKMLILDEPFSGLDYSNSIKLSNIIKKYAKNKYILISTHQMKFVDDFANNILVLNKGKVKFSGDVLDLKTSSSLYFMIENTNLNKNILEKYNLKYVLKEQKLAIKTISKNKVLEIVKENEINEFTYNYLTTSDMIIDLIGEKYE